jgi:hypothetical protein
MNFYRYIRYIVTLAVMLLCGVAYAGEISGQTEDEVAKKKVMKGFCGGMMLHSGYQFGSDNPIGVNPKGATFGMGGVAKLQFTKHFRTGFEGYFSSVGLKKDVLKGSFNKIFWAGAIADWFWKCDRFYPYVGVGVGGGMETSLYMLDGNKSDWVEDDIVYRKQPFGYVDPYVGVSYAVGGIIRLTLRTDWMVAVNNEGLNRPLGPRIYFGILFSR